MNKKGFTVIELILSFAFVSILTISLFSLVMNYKDKEQYAQDITELNSFRNNITMMIQKDLQVHILKTINYCNDGGGIVNRCINLEFQDGTSKQFRIAYKEETVPRKTSTFKYYRYFIIYDDLVFEAPAAGNVEIRTDFMLEYSTKEDSLENHLGLYKIRVGLYHKNLNTNTEISIVAVGNTKADTGTGAYKAYHYGQRLHVQVNSGEASNQFHFYVIKESDTYDASVTLLYDGIWTSGNTQFNPNTGSGNDINSSSMSGVIDSIYSSWNNISNRSDIRLLTANEATNLSRTSPVATFYDAATTIKLDQPPSFFLNRGSFWTQSPYLSKTKMDSAWYIRITDGKAYLERSLVTASYYVRPVIKIEKQYILGID